MKNASCRSCTSNKSIPIVYGFPTPELSQRAESGEVALADSPDWSDGPDRKCLDCGQHFFSNSTSQRRFDEETAHQLSRLAEMERGDFVLLDTRSTSAEDIANALTEKYDENAAWKEPRSKEEPKNKRQRKP